MFFGYTIYNPGRPILTEEQVGICANHDLILMHRKSYTDDTETRFPYDEITALNPDIQIAIYQLGSETYDTQDAWNVLDINSVARWENARSHSMGNLNTDHDDYFLLDSSGDRVMMKYSPEDNYVLDFGNAGWLDYWKEATLTDINGQPWEQSGIQADNLLTDSYNSNTVTDNVTYTTPALHNAAMNAFSEGFVQMCKANGLYAFANRTHTRTDTAVAAWVAQDQSANPLDAALEEGFVVSGWEAFDANFRTHNEWVRQVGVAGDMVNTSLVAQAHSNLSEGESGTDNNGRSLTCEDVFSYAVGSYLLAQRASGPKTMFLFGRPLFEMTSRPEWYGVYDDLKAWLPLSDFVEHPSHSQLYWREFDRGYVLVNPSTAVLTGVAVPAGYVPAEMTYDELVPQAYTSTVDIAQNRAAYFMADTPALSNAQDDTSIDGVTATCDSTLAVGQIYYHSKDAAFSGTDEEIVAEIMANGVEQDAALSNSVTVTGQQPGTAYYGGWAQNPDAVGHDGIQLELTTQGVDVVFTVPAGDVGNYNAVINWGDDTGDSTITTFDDVLLAHTYAVAGDYSIVITGIFPHLKFANTGTSKDKVVGVSQLGRVGALSYDSSLNGAQNITNIVAGKVDSSAVTTGIDFLANQTFLETGPDLRGLDTSEMLSMQRMMQNWNSCVTPPDLRNFNTSKVANTAYMMASWLAVTSPPDVSSFDMSNVTNATYMFLRWPSAGASDLAIDVWDVGKVTNFAGFLSENQLTTACYDRTLIAWAAQDLSGVTTDIDFGSSKYTGSNQAVVDARTAIIAMIAGTITDGGAA